MVLVSQGLAFASNGEQKTGGASLLIALAAAFLILLLAIFLILSLAVRQARPLFMFAESVFRSIKQALTENPDIRKLVDGHPGFFH